MAYIRVTCDTPEEFFKMLDSLRPATCRMSFYLDWIGDDYEAGLKFVFENCERINGKTAKECIECIDEEEYERKPELKNSGVTLEHFEFANDCNNGYPSWFVLEDTTHDSYVGKNETFMIEFPAM